MNLVYMYFLLRRYRQILNTLTVKKKKKTEAFKSSSLHYPEILVLLGELDFHISLNH